MKRAKTTKQAAAADVRSVTGRDGAIDFAAKTEFFNESAETDMSAHIYRSIELVGTSTKSIEDAVHAAIGRADKTIRNLRWFEIIRSSGHIDDGKVSQFQVTLKVGFRMEQMR